MISDEILEEYKLENNISHSSEDPKIKDQLSRSVAYVLDMCGKFDLDGNESTDLRAKELVFNRARYAYNDAVEFFEDNFLSEITSLGIDLAGEKDEKI